MNPLTKKHTQGSTERRSLKVSLSRVALILCLQLTFFSVAWAQTPEAATTTAPLLTLDEAVRIASGTNSLLKNTVQLQLHLDCGSVSARRAPRSMLGPRHHEGRKIRATVRSPR
jgi:hypothetical protein